MLKKATFSPTQPWRAKTRLVPSKAAASEDPRRYPPHFVELFARTMDLGERKNPSRDSNFRESLRYVEGLNDARTPLADFFSVLLDLGLPFLDSGAKARVR
jgi:DNA topoisomerase IB